MKAITSAPQFASDVLAAPGPVLVKFGSEWCAPCKAMAPMLDELESAYAGRVEFVSVDTSHVAAVAAQFHVRSLPTVLLFKGGAVQASIIGMQGRPALVKALDALA